MPMTLLNSLRNPQPSSAGGAPTNRSLLKPVQAIMGVEPLDTDERRDTAWRYDTEEALKKALAAKGPGAFVTGVRPLDSWGPIQLPFLDSPAGSWADRKNVETNHEHLFYLDADGELHHVGYFRPSDKTGKDGGIVFDNPKDKAQDKKWMGSVSQYHFGPVLEGGEITREKLDLKGFRAGNYNMRKHNCQDYIAELWPRLLDSGKAPQE